MRYMFIGTTIESAEPGHERGKMKIERLEAGARYI